MTSNYSGTTTVTTAITSEDRLDKHEGRIPTVKREEGRSPLNQIWMSVKRVRQGGIRGAAILGWRTRADCDGIVISRWIYKTPFFRSNTRSVIVRWLRASNWWQKTRTGEWRRTKNTGNKNNGRKIKRVRQMARAAAGGSQTKDGGSDTK